jgi:hypothetical protein
MAKRRVRFRAAGDRRVPWDGDPGEMQTFIDPDLLDRLRVGPLASHLDAYLKRIEQEGFLPSSVPMQMYAVARFSNWLRWRAIGHFPWLSFGRFRGVTGPLGRGYRESMAHISEDDLERYAMKTLPDAQLDELEDHLLICPELVFPVLLFPS